VASTSLAGVIQTRVASGLEGVSAALSLQIAAVVANNPGKTAAAILDRQDVVGLRAALLASSQRDVGLSLEVGYQAASSSSARRSSSAYGSIMGRSSRWAR
jgi:hypothetical protein